MTDQSTVYPPSRDTYVLLGAVTDVEGRRFLDLGCGNGLVGAYAAAMGADVVCADVNPDAVAHASARAEDMGVVVTGLVSDLFGRVEGLFDVITFNPPYLPTSRLNLKGPCATCQWPSWEEGPARTFRCRSPKWLAYDGGRKGRELTDRFIEGVGRHLAPEGRALLIAIADNDVPDLLRTASGRGLTGKIVDECEAPDETLFLVELRHKKRRFWQRA